MNVGRALLVSALFMFLSMVVSVLNGMDSAFGPLAISFIITFIRCIPVHIREAVSGDLSTGRIPDNRAVLASVFYFRDAAVCTVGRGVQPCKCLV